MPGSYCIVDQSINSWFLRLLFIFRQCRHRLYKRLFQRRLDKVPVEINGQTVHPNSLTSCAAEHAESFSQSTVMCVCVCVCCHSFRSHLSTLTRQAARLCDSPSITTVPCRGGCGKIIAACPTISSGCAVANGLHQRNIMTAPTKRCGKNNTSHCMPGAIRCGEKQLFFLSLAATHISSLIMAGTGPSKWYAIWPKCDAPSACTFCLNRDVIRCEQ